MEEVKETICNVESKRTIVSKSRKPSYQVRIKILSHNPTDFLKEFQIQLENKNIKKIFGITIDPDTNKFEYNIFEELEDFMELDNSEETDKIIGEFRTADMTIPELSIKLQEHSNIVYT
ncbi:38470_t:CDS:2, partial [Gigaspora margarita]